MTITATDLFCGAGGCSVGYARAGFDVVGVDIRPQPRYPFRFIQGDALDMAWWMAVLEPEGEYEGFDAVHASPPCQAYSTTRTMHGNVYPELVGEVRALLEVTGVPWVIENVVGAPLRNPLLLCGSSFGLGVRRHRLFETSPMILMRPPCDHASQPFPIDVTGGGPSRAGRTRTGGGVPRKPRNIAEAQAAMGIDWGMTRAELNEAVPPAYTEFIGSQLLASFARSDSGGL